MDRKSASGSEDEFLVREAVTAFYQAFNDGFPDPCDFAHEDWDHISPGGGWARGREAVLKEVRAVHATFLKDVYDNIEEMSVSFPGRDVAMATVRSLMTPFTTPDGVSHVNERHIRTFLLVRGGGRWLVLRDHNTTISQIYE